ncbi:hypothetical protein CLJU_c18170 [Clostridium ljungdahlii DSM 13528]|uniref:Uncharacterized protein n=1 Tax=Clostridium ljungdahlii (strain ATCC 55383 / DSM 13528 / PETC) TaxID=748727 RepID=D8GI18_CLOLD|nr:hypothetical protein CLJU_c18170 [Clostridium ljungdahlii DSM 13528]
MNILTKKSTYTQAYFYNNEALLNILYIRLRKKSFKNLELLNCLRYEFSKVLSIF